MSSTLRPLVEGAFVRYRDGTSGTLQKIEFGTLFFRDYDLDLWYSNENIVKQDTIIQGSTVYTDYYYVMCDQRHKKDIVYVSLPLPEILCTMIRWLKKTKIFLTSKRERNLTGSNEHLNHPPLKGKRNES